MTTTPERCTWRDLVPQLTLGQIRRLAELEEKSTLSPNATREALLRPLIVPIPVR